MKSHHGKMLQNRNTKLAGDKPRGKQFGYLFGGVDARLIAHELGHGIFTLQHSFDNNYGGGSSQGRTANLMDYARGVDLGAFQWSVMANPAPLTWFDSEEDGMALSNTDKKATRQIIETLRFGYTFNRRVVIEYPDKAYTGMNREPLGDNKLYDEITIYFPNKPNTVNPRESFMEVYSGDVAKGRFGFISAGGQRAEIELMTLAGEQHNNLKTYIQCDSPEAWRSNIDNLINGTGSANLANLNALPDEALAEVTNDQRIRLLNKIVNAAVSDYYPLAARIMANVPEEQIKDIFAKLSNSTIFASLKNRMNHEAYTDFVRASLSVFYRQDDLIGRLQNVHLDNVFVWHKGRNAVNGIGSEISYTLTLTDNSLEIRGGVEVWRPTAPRNYPLEHLGPHPLYDTQISITDMMALRVDTDLGDIPGNESVVYPIPAFYFDWLVTNENREQRIRALDAAITITSFAVGLGELRLVATAGRFIFALRAASVVKSAVDLVMLDEEIKEVLENQPVLGGFFANWSYFSLAYDLVTFDLKNVSANRRFFDALLASYSTYRLTLRNNLGEELYKILNDFMEEIEANR